jgi:hypothetical protein
MREKQKVIFLLDSGARFSVLPFSPGSRSKNKIVAQGISAQPLEIISPSHWPLLGEAPYLLLFPCGS